MSLPGPRPEPYDPLWDTTGDDLAEQIDRAYAEQRLAEARRIQAGRRRDEPLPCGPDGVGHGVSRTAAVVVVVAYVAAIVIVALGVSGVL